MKKIVNKLLFKPVLLFVLVAAFVGCSSLKLYPDNLYKNLSIKLQKDKSTFFTDIETYLHIYKIDKQCKRTYMGSVELNKKNMQVGLPVNQKLFLDFAFVRAGGGSSSVIKEGTMINVKSKTRYLADVLFEDGIYDVSMSYRKNKKNKSAKFKMIPIKACVKS